MGKYYLGNQSGNQVNFSLTDSSGVRQDLNLTGLFLDKTGTAVNSELLDGKDSSYFRNAGNLTGSILIEYTGTAPDALKLGGQPPSYYLNAINLTGTFTGNVSGSSANAELFGSQPPSYYLNAENLTGTFTGIDDAEFLGGQPPSYYLNALNLTGVFTGNISGSSADAQLLNGQSGSYYLNLGNHTGVANFSGTFTGGFTGGFTGNFTGNFVGDLSGTAAHIDYARFQTGTPQAIEIAKLQWSDDFGALDLGLIGGNAVARLGQDTLAYVRNAETGTISKGQPVYLFGAQGDKATVKLASNLSDTTSARTLGLAVENIAAGQLGYVKSNGVVDGINLGAYSPGDILWLGSGAGTLTATKPQAPLHMVFIGVVERANNGNGQIYVKVQNGYEIDELHDVKIINPAEGQLLSYNSATGVWRNTDTLQLNGTGEHYVSGSFRVGAALYSESILRNVTIIS